MYNHVNKKNGEAAPLVSKELYNIVMAVRRVLLFPPDAEPKYGALHLFRAYVLLTAIATLDAER